MSAYGHAWLIAAAAAVPAAAQQGWVIEADRTVLTPSHPDVVVTMSLTHAPDDYAWAGALADIHIDESFEWYPFSLITCAMGGCFIDRPWGMTYRGGQLSFPPAGIYPDPATPLPVFELRVYGVEPGTGPRSIRTDTELYTVYLERSSSVSETREAHEASLVISYTDCEADCDADGQLTLFDFLSFQSLFSAEDGYADCNNDGLFDALDFTCFQITFELGCP